MSARVAVLTFPGTNCDDDCAHVLGSVLNHDVLRVWHKETTLPEGLDGIVIPGGFSYGDYLRAGAIARFSPVMPAVKQFAERGGPVMGICNGFQVLLELGLLPGAMQKNESGRFVCKPVHLKVTRHDTRFTRGISAGHLLQVPVAHAEGNWTCDEATWSRVQGEGMDLLRYCQPDGTVDRAANPNGARDNIAGLINAEGNVLGLMPHPERSSEALLGGTDGRLLFSGLLSGRA
tara:strand:+ start:250 stop:948 length:699 start_codon:yes stop_codon:yes gene_type:complete